MNSISIDTAIIITDLSKRTLWRRVSDGTITKQEPDGRGRAMLSFAELLPLICIPTKGDDLLMILRADSGDADAQADLGQLFAAAGKPALGVQWYSLAAEQGNADAMQLLGWAYAAGEGIERDENLALMWIAKAAAGGHAIASQQISELRRSR